MNMDNKIISELREKINDLNWLEDRMRIFYERYPVFENSNCDIQFDKETNSDKLAEYKYDIYEDYLYDDYIVIYLKEVREYLLNKYRWDSYGDVIDLLKTIILHEYRHYLQADKLNELNMLYVLDTKWIQELLEEDASVYSESFVYKGKELDLTSLITKILVEDKVDLSFC